MANTEIKSDKPVLTGLFRDRDSAERAYQSIADRGYGRDDVNVVMSDETRKRHFSGTTADGRADRARHQGGRRRRHRRRDRRQPRRHRRGDRRGRHDDRLARPRPGHRRAARRGDRRRRRRCGDRRHRRRADRLGHPGRARQGVRPGHPRRRHPDGRAPAQRRRRDLPGRLLEGQPRRARLPVRARPALGDLSLDQRLQRRAVGRGLRPEPRARPAAPRGRRLAPVRRHATVGSLTTGARAGTLRGGPAGRHRRRRRVLVVLGGDSRRRRCRRRRRRRRRLQPGGDVVADARVASRRRDRSCARPDRRARRAATARRCRARSSSVCQNGVARS